MVSKSSSPLAPLSLQLERNKSKIKLAAQNFYQKDFGAYTGEISIAQLRGVVSYALIGHSERRFIFGETNKDISQKVAAAIRSGITPILCIGETENQRNFGETIDVLRDELLGGLSEIDTEDVKKCLIAYEPVWAISTSKQARPATPDEIAASIQLIKEQLIDIYGQETAEEIPLLYGGSVNPNNAGAYLTIPGINGVLVGESSLISDNFNEIIETAKRVRE